MQDQTEQIRRELVEKINSNPGFRTELEQVYGQVWDTTQLTQDFEVMGFMAPYVMAKRKSDNKVGSLEFQHSPRFYYHFVED